MQWLLQPTVGETESSAERQLVEHFVSNLAHWMVETNVNHPVVQAFEDTALLQRLIPLQAYWMVKTLQSVHEHASTEFRMQTRASLSSAKSLNGQLYVRVVSARIQSKFSCNPQCRIAVGSTQLHTEAQFRTDTPKYNEEFMIKVDDPLLPLEISIHNKDKDEKKPSQAAGSSSPGIKHLLPSLAGKAPSGHLKIALTDLEHSKVVKQWFPLRTRARADEQSESFGEVLVKLHYTYPPAAMAVYDPQQLQKRIVTVVGYGQIGMPIVHCLLSTAAVQPDEMRVASRSVENMKALVDRGVHTTTDATAAAVDASVVIVAVQPLQIGSVLSAIRSVLKPSCLVLVLAAGVREAKLRSMLGESNALVRLGMNAAALEAIRAEAAARAHASFDKSHSATPDEASHAPTSSSALGRLAFKGLFDGDGVFAMIGALERVCASIGVRPSSTAAVVFESRFGGRAGVAVTADDTGAKQSVVMPSVGSAEPSSKVVRKAVKWVRHCSHV